MLLFIVGTVCVLGVVYADVVCNTGFKGSLKKMWNKFF